MSRAEPLRPRDLLLRQTPPEATPKPIASPPEAANATSEWLNPAAVRRRPIARPWEGWHSLAWVAWVAGAATCAMRTTNPIYLALLLACAVLVWSYCGGAGALGRSFGLMVKIGAFLFVLHLVFSIITASNQRGPTIILKLPEIRLPELLGGLHLGGTISAEQLVSAAVKGMQLWTLLLLFGTFNACVNHYRLLQFSPRFLFHAGLITTIGLAFVPQTVLRLQAIRDAQRLRGHRFRSWRDALPLMTPLISSGLERALTLAEAMESRGYGRTVIAPQQLRRMQFASLVGICLLGMGLVGVLLGASKSWQSMIGWIAIGFSIGLIGQAWWRISRSIPRQAYRRTHWYRADSLIVVGAILAPLSIGWIGAVTYAPYPRMHLPALDLLILLPIGLLSLPALLRHPSR